MGYAVKMSLFPVWHYCCFKFCRCALDFQMCGAVIGEWLYF